MGIGIGELLALKVGIKQDAKMYNLPFVSATLRLIEDIKKYNKINGLQKKIDILKLQKYVLDETCSRQSQALITLARLQSHGIIEQQIILMKNFLANNEYNIDRKSNN